MKPTSDRYQISRIVGIFQMTAVLIPLKSGIMLYFMMGLKSQQRILSGLWNEP